MSYETMAALASETSYDSASRWNLLLNYIGEVLRDIPSDHWLSSVLREGVKASVDYDRAQYDSTEALKIKTDKLRTVASRILDFIPNLPTSDNMAIYRKRGGVSILGVTLNEKKSFRTVQFPDLGQSVRIATTDRDTPNCERGWIWNNLIPRPTV